MKRNYLAAAWEAVRGKVVEVVATDVEELRLDWKATRDFGVASSLASGMLGLNLEEGKKRGRKSCRMAFEAEKSQVRV